MLKLFIFINHWHLNLTKASASQLIHADWFGTYLVYRAIPEPFWCFLPMAPRVYACWDEKVRLFYDYRNNGIKGLISYLSSYFMVTIQMVSVYFSKMKQGYCYHFLSLAADGVNWRGSCKG
ncbi:hypothetical protein WH95_02380 [Kiloniella litopenaei]|uniref:Uncharacterized protein n=1 Tax=Kiloniella litopenaei TaxID=1549748 RepID=A0A0M2RDY7_9PROT|nr:hypothetical protein WH95_02380 [Kiloniella litopenaei]